MKGKGHILLMGILAILLGQGCGVEDRIKRPERPLRGGEVTLKGKRLVGHWLKLPAAAESAEGFDQMQATILRFQEDLNLAQYDLRSDRQPCPLDVPYRLQGREPSLIVVEDTLECEGDILTPTKIEKNDSGTYARIEVDDAAGGSWVLLPTDESTVIYLINSALAEDFNLAPGLKDYRIAGPTDDEVQKVAATLLDLGRNPWRISEDLQNTARTGGGGGIAVAEGKVVDESSCRIIVDPLGAVAGGKVAGLRYDTISRTSTHWLWTEEKDSALRPGCIEATQLPTPDSGISCIGNIGANQVTVDFAPGFGVKRIRCELSLLERPLTGEDVSRAVGELLLR